jgi:hypothetical protein
MKSIKSDGKQLETLVAFVEQTLLPKGFQVKTNKSVVETVQVKVLPLVLGLNS